MKQLPFTLSAGTGLLLMITLQLVTASCCYLAGGSLSVWSVIISVTAGVIWTALTSGWRGVATLTAVLTCCIAVSAFLFDSAYDSVHYHKEFVLRLAEGWNPVYETDYVPDRIWWIHHYGKFGELTGAAIYLLTGVFNTAAAASAIFMASASLIFYDLLRRIYHERLTRAGAAAVTVVTMFNPVVASQIFSFCNDLYCYGGACVMAAAFAVLLGRRQSAPVSGICCGIIVCMSIVMVNVKFTHAFYAGLVWMGAGSVLLRRRQWRDFAKLTAAGCIVMLFSVAVVGWHPYLTNALHFGNMFFPVAGSGFDYTPGEFAGMNRLMKFIVGNLSQPNQAWSVIYSPLDPDNWLGGRCAPTLGFGVLYLPLLILSFAVLAINGRKSLWLTVISVTGVALSFVFVVSWVARFNPFAWLPIPLALLAALTAGRMRRTGIAIGVLAVFSSALIFARNTGAAACMQRRISLLQKAAAECGEMPRIAFGDDVTLPTVITIPFTAASADSLRADLTFRIYGRGATGDHASFIELSECAADHLQHMNTLDGAMFRVAAE